jgi:ABC-type Fe3+ transport system substrate-binding protein
VITKDRIIRTAAAMAIGAVASSANPALAADWQAGAGADWQTILAAAKKEGGIAVAGPPEIAGPMTDGFKRDTGIDVEFLGGETRERSSRIGREVRAGRVTIDFLFTGSVELPLVKAGFFEDLKSRLMLPGVTDPKNWAGGELKWVDNTKRYMLQTQAFVSSVPIYDGNSIKPGELTTWNDLLDPKYKGKIVAYDPRSGGPGAQIAGYIGATKGIDFLKSLYVGQQVVYSLSSRQMTEWIARGVYMVGMGIPSADYLTLTNAGIKNLVPANFKDGPGAVSGGFSVVLMPKGPPHPNAATVFLNWVASAPGQIAYSQGLKTISRRTDVSLNPSVAAYTVPKPGITYQDQYAEDYLVNVRAKILEQVMQAIGGK